MGRIYESDKVHERIADIAVESGKSSSPSYKETLCHPRYMYATLCGCLLSVLQ
jgi:hypothetical protein